MAQLIRWVDQVMLQDVARDDKESTASVTTVIRAVLDGVKVRTQGHCLLSVFTCLSRSVCLHLSVCLSFRNWSDWLQRDKIALPPCLLSNHSRPWDSQKDLTTSTEPVGDQELLLRRR